ncbi:cytochrome c [Accumulibacter sp.]|uniref:c-type cytochrome n=1 Tax=Accumulibacter sp. TaxID=2053492 RepID=UPI0028C39774|nr:cytochrome c [Accumulibacter sp.]
MPILRLLALLLSSQVVLAEPVRESIAPSAERQKQLVHLVRQDCGSCHGMTLQGGLGPSLLPEALRDKPLESLVATIHGGRPGTPMPPWHRFLSEAEAQWIVEQLLAGFPD